MRFTRQIALAALAPALLLGACAGPQTQAIAPAPAEPNTMVVLLTDAGGKVGRVTVTNRAGSRALDRASSATRILDAATSPTEPAAMSTAEIEAMFGAALSAQPPAPRHFTLYFEPNSTELTAAARGTFPDILAAVRDYASVDTSVVGHSDTAGDTRANLELSLRRALAVGALLIAGGIDPAALEITSHGEENPLVATGDNVSEPRNRRVEVTVR